MKRIVKSAGAVMAVLLAVAGASAQTPYGLAPQLTRQELSKTWSVSAALRGFYDDNYNTGTKGSEESSVGAEIAPAISANFPMEQTYVGFSLMYSGRYYADRPENEFDHTVQLNAVLNHAFTERFKLDLNDNFVISQEPELLDPTTQSSFIRTEGNNIRNRGSANLTMGLTPAFSAVVGYANTFYDYEQDGAGSRSALLDRVEHLGSVNGRFQISPATVILLGYQYGLADYTSKDFLTSATNVVIGSVTNAIPNRNPNLRNSRSQYGFVGADHSFTAQLTGSLRGGIQYTEYPNSAAGSEVSPYADAALSWTYSPGSYLQMGARHQRNATDVAFNAQDLSPTLDAESTVVYGAINHQLTANLTISLLGQVQFSTFNQGTADDQNETFFALGVNLAYRINQFLAAEAGYNFDSLNTDLAFREFDRNRVYVGLRANY